MGIKFDNKEQTQKIIDKIGKDKDVRDFVWNKVFLVICLYVVWIVCFLIMAFKDFSAKDTLSVVFNLLMVIIGAGLDQPFITGRPRVRPLHFKEQKREHL